MKVSVVCPFFNEKLILERAIAGMLQQLKRSGLNWELVLVNDGSVDESLSIARECLAIESNARVISYEKNQGRGYALWRGIQESSGEIVVTTEIDLSWGEHIVEDIARKFSEDPLLDAVVASPNISGGGYKNVPARRVLISKLGNRLLRLLFTKQITMYTGMTRGYRREIIKNFSCDERGKEFHLDVVFKLILLQCNIEEVPAILEWKDSKLSDGSGGKRKSSSKILRLISTHLNFAAFANPIRYFWAFSSISGISSLVLIASAILRNRLDQIALFLIIFAILLAISAILLLGFGVISSQNNRILKELWRTQMLGSSSSRTKDGEGPIGK